MLGRVREYRFKTKTGYYIMIEAQRVHVQSYQIDSVTVETIRDQKKASNRKKKPKKRENNITKVRK